MAQSSPLGTQSSLVDVGSPQIRSSARKRRHGAPASSRVVLEDSEDDRTRQSSRHEFRDQSSTTRSNPDASSHTKTAPPKKEKARWQKQLESNLAPALLLTPESMTTQDEGDGFDSTSVRRLSSLKLSTRDDNATRRSQRPSAAKKENAYNMKIHPQDDRLPFRRRAEPIAAEGETVPDGSDHRPSRERPNDDITRADDVDDPVSDEESVESIRSSIEKAPTPDPKATRRSQRPEAHKPVNYSAKKHPMDAHFGRRGVKRRKITPLSDTDTRSSRTAQDAILIQDDSPSSELSRDLDDEILSSLPPLDSLNPARGASPFVNVSDNKQGKDKASALHAQSPEHVRSSGLSILGLELYESDEESEHAGEDESDEHVIVQIDDVARRPASGTTDDDDMTEEFLNAREDVDLGDGANVDDSTTATRPIELKENISIMREQAVDDNKELSVIIDDGSETEDDIGNLTDVLNAVSQVLASQSAPILLDKRRRDRSPESDTSRTFSAGRSTDEDRRYSTSARVYRSSPAKPMRKSMIPVLRRSRRFS